MSFNFQESKLAAVVASTYIRIGAAAEGQGLGSLNVLSMWKGQDRAHQKMS
jgi:hypothetical protein